MDTSDTVRTDGAHDLGTQQIGLRRPAGGRSATDRNHVHVRLHDPRGNGGGQREARSRRVAARNGNAGCAYQFLTGTGQFSKTAWPGTGMSALVVLLPGCGILQPEVPRRSQ